MSFTYYLKGLSLAGLFLTSTMLTAADTYSDGMNAARAQVREGNFAEARDALRNTLDRSGLTPLQRMDAVDLMAQTYVRQNNRNAAHALYPEIRRYAAEVMDSDDFNRGQKVTAGLKAADTLVLDGDYRGALSLTDKLLGMPDLSVNDEVRIRRAQAHAHTRAGDTAAAGEIYQGLLQREDLPRANKAQVYGDLMGLHQRQIRDPYRLREVVEAIVQFEPVSRLTKGRVRTLATFRGPHSFYNPPDNVRFGWEHFLKQEELTNEEMHTAYLGLTEAYIELGQLEQAYALTGEVLANTSLDSHTRAFADLTHAGLGAIMRDAGFDLDTRIAALERKYQIDQATLYNVLNESAACLRILAQGKLAREMNQRARGMVDQPEPSYSVTYSDQVPPGAGGWLLSTLIENPDKRSSRFMDYNVDHARNLYADVAADRVVEADDADVKGFYFDNTAFYMLYDDAGWHIFMLCGENDLAQKRRLGQNLGALEFYFAPGPENTYYQWIVSLNDGATTFYDWNSTYRNFRTPHTFATTETVYSGNQIGTYVFFPWEMIYDVLPFDHDEDWSFQVIRWSPAGGLGWTGSRVHATGDFGLIEWQQPSQSVLAKIRLNLLESAWVDYQKSRDRLVENHWDSRDFGDSDFMRTLQPVVDRLDALGTQLQDLRRNDYRAVQALFDEAVKEWREFRFTVEALRGQYLQQQLTGRSGY